MTETLTFAPLTKRTVIRKIRERKDNEEITDNLALRKKKRKRKSEKDFAE
jgi:hypothetical protein